MSRAHDFIFRCSFSPFELGFIRAQLWCGTNVLRLGEEPIGLPEVLKIRGNVEDQLDVAIPKIDADVLVRVVRQCAKFLWYVEKKMNIHLADEMQQCERAGHLFCLSRNETGAGFLDGDYLDLNSAAYKELHDISKNFEPLHWEATMRQGSNGREVYSVYSY